MVRMGMLVVVLTGTAAHAAGQERPTPEVPAAVREAQAVVLAAYPELRHAPIAWRQVETSDGFVLAAHQAPPPFEDPTKQPLLVETRATRDLDGRLQALALDGELTGLARLRTLQQRAATEPAATVVRDAGGRYVPGDAVAASALVTAAVGRATGAGAATDVRFEVMAEPGAAGMTWRVELEDASRTGQRTMLVFEPVDGRLIGLVRR